MSQARWCQETRPQHRQCHVPTAPPREAMLSRRSFAPNTIRTDTPETRNSINAPLTSPTSLLTLPAKVATPAPALSPSGKARGQPEVATARSRRTQSSRARGPEPRREAKSSTRRKTCKRAFRAAEPRAAAPLRPASSRALESSPSSPIRC
jgi:hypothetical protein